MDMNSRKNHVNVTAESAAKMTAGILGALSAAIHISLLSAKIATTAATAAVNTVASVGEITEALAADIGKSVAEAEVKPKSDTEQQIEEMSKQIFSPPKND